MDFLARFRAGAGSFFTKRFVPLEISQISLIILTISLK